jgi:hypothetical protein
MGGRIRGVGRSVANATGPEAGGERCRRCAGRVTGADGMPVRTRPPAQQVPGVMPCGQQDESALLLCPSTWPAQPAGIVFAVAVPA